MKTELKVWVMNAVMTVGAVAIIALVGPEAMKPRDYGGGYQQGVASALFLAVVQTGIPTLIYLAFTHAVLAHVMFKEGELSEYRARRRVQTMSRFEKKAPALLEKPNAKAQPRPAPDRVEPSASAKVEHDD